MNEPKVSIIIPLYIIRNGFFQDLRKFSKQNYSNFEILVVSDIKVKLPKIKNVGLKLLVTGSKRTGPAEKRDLAIKRAKGSICAFIDDDAFPDKNWIKEATKWFKVEDIVAVGGPGITPKEEGYWEKLGGMVYESIFTSGLAQERFVSKGKKVKEVEDWPAYNLFVRRDTLLSVGGYDVSYYGGEDTFLCMKLLKKGIIIYDPSVIVNHHRRKLFLPHARQIMNIGVHRGYFAKVYPKTSRKLFYFIPSLLALSFFALLSLSFVSEFAYHIFFILFMLTIMIGMLTAIKKTTVINAFIVSLGIIFTHLTYGSCFVIGFFKRNLKK